MDGRPISGVRQQEFQPINGLGSPALDFVHALEMLTGRRDLCYLTMLTWARVLPRSALLRRSRAWCDSCARAWRQARQPIYEPLLWALRAVTVCPYHRRLLRQVCPNCERLIGPLDSRSRSGYCSRCGQSLVPTVGDSGAGCGTLSSNESMWAIWVASTLGELLSTAPQIACPPTREHLVETIGLCIRRASSGNTSEFARLMHVGRGDVSRWQRGKALPPLALLLTMAYRLETSLSDFLLGCPRSIPSRGFLRSAPVETDSNAQRRTAQPRPRINRLEVSRLLHAALAENPSPSLTQVIQRITHTEVTVRRHFPEVCFEIAKHYAEYRARRAVARKTQAAEEVRRLAHELHAKGIALTRQNMRPLLTSSDYLNLDEGRAALRQVRRDLGL